MKWVLGAIVALGVGTEAQRIQGSPTKDPSPCAIISSSAASQISASPKADSVTLKPSEVYACLKSVPFDENKAVEQVSWIQNVVQLQSTLAYLKDPPPSYQMPAVDIVGGLNNLSTFISKGKYTTEYDIELDLYNLIRRAYDGHFDYTPFLVNVFEYSLEFALAQISLDGIQTPKIYVHSDIINARNGHFTPSAVTSCDDWDSNKLLDLGRGFQDLDALYNAIFYNPAISGDGNDPGQYSARAFTSHSDTTVCKFENGTSRTFSAKVKIDKGHAATLPQNGQDFFKLLTSQGSPASPSAKPAKPAASTLPTNYPVSPVVNQKHYQISGFFPDGTENADVAVLSVATFEADDGVDFLNLNAEFLAKCKAAGKKRLVVDVRGNPGGEIDLGYKLFTQLFPDVVPYSRVRMRASDAANAIGKVASSDSKLSASAFNAKKWFRPSSGSKYDSWEQFYGPTQQRGDNFTNMGSWEFSNAAYLTQFASQYYHVPKLPSQVFSAENVILLTDGQCSSTCSDFANLMIKQGHVTTVTLGGRPNNNKDMAVVGGVQGGQIQMLSDLQAVAKEVIQAQSDDETQKILKPLLSPPPIALFSEKGVSVNFLDNIAENDTTATPLQFSGGIPADCRSYYTAADMISVASTWERIAQGIKAGGKNLCIGGTLKEKKTS